jgi:phosphomevalonate kinase
MGKPHAEHPSVLAPGKVFLAGEYSVLAGAPAVVSTVGVHARAYVQRSVRKRGAQATFVDAILRKLAPGLGARFRRRGQRIALDLSAFHDGGTKMGIGSSAAGVAAVSGLVRVLEKGSVGRRDVLGRRCATLHRRLQDGLGSGADAAACCRGGVIRFTMPSTLRALPDPEWVSAVAVALGGGGRTKRVLEQHARRSSDRERRTMLNLEVFAEAAEMVIDALGREDWHTLRLGVNLTAAAYDELGDILGAELITPEDKLAMRAARRLGGVSRPSGAGGGDLHIAFFPDPGPATRFSRWASTRKHPVIPITPDPLGTRLA